MMVNVNQPLDLIMKLVIYLVKLWGVDSYYGYTISRTQYDPVILLNRDGNDGDGY